MAAGEPQTAANVDPEASTVDSSQPSGPETSQRNRESLFIGGDRTEAAAAVDEETQRKSDLMNPCYEVSVTPSSKRQHAPLNFDRKSRKRIKKYYSAQNGLLSSIDDIQLHLEHYQENSFAKKTVLTAQNVAKITFAINFTLFAAKVAAAALSGSLAIVSSVLDSAVDLVSGVLLWWSSRAMKHANHYHYPRGRRKLEPVAIVILAVIMSLASVQVIQSSIFRIVDYVNYDVNCEVAKQFYNESDVFCGTEKEINDLVDDCLDGASGPTMTIPTIVICCVTIVLKLVLFLICRNIKNPTVQALAQDHRNDVVSNTSALIFGYLGYKVLKYCDPVGAILIGVYIIVNWFITAYEQIKMITGYTASPDFINKLTWLILQHDNRICYIDDLKAFHFGNNYLVEVDLVLPETIGFRDSHDLGETLQIKLEKLEEVERVFVHVDYESGYKQQLTNF